jgi:hypothetical protein
VTIQVILQRTHPAHRPYLYALLVTMYEGHRHDSVFGRIEDIYWGVFANNLRLREAYVRAGVQLKRRDNAWLN